MRRNCGRVAGDGQRPALVELRVVVDRGTRRRRSVRRSRPCSIIARCQATAASAAVAPFEGGEADRQERRAPPAVASAGAEADVLPLDDDDADRRARPRAATARSTARCSRRRRSRRRRRGRRRQHGADRTERRPDRSPTTGSAARPGIARLRYADDLAAGGHVRPAAQRPGGLVSGPVRQRLCPLLRRLPLDAVRRLPGPGCSGAPAGRGATSRVAAPDGDRGDRHPRRVADRQPRVARCAHRPRLEHRRLHGRSPSSSATGRRSCGCGTPAGDGGPGACSPTSACASGGSISGGVR